MKRFGLLVILATIFLVGLVNGQTAITDCQNINSAGEYYIANNISISNTCIEISSNDVTIDGTGFYMDNTACGGYNNIRAIGVSNITIKNLNVVDYGSSCYSNTIDFQGVSNSLIQNVYTLGSDAIYIEDSSNNIRIENVYGELTNYLIFFSPISNPPYNNYVNNVTSVSERYSPIYLDQAINTTIENIRIINQTQVDVGYGMYTIGLNNPINSVINNLYVENSISFIDENSSLIKGQLNDYLTLNNITIPKNGVNLILNDMTWGDKPPVSGGTGTITFNNILLESSEGSINFNSLPITLTNTQPDDGWSLDTISILNNQISADSNVKSFLNSPATIVFNNLPTNFTNPKILKDGYNCGIECQNLTDLNAGNVIIQVNGFSTYSIGESNEPVVIPPTQVTGTLYQSMAESGAGLGIFIQLMAKALPILLIGLAMVGIIFAVGMGIASLFKSYLK